MRISDWSSDVCSSDLAIGKASATSVIARPVVKRPQPRSAQRPAIGAATAPAAPASANSAMPRWVRPKSGPASSSGTEVQNRLKAQNSGRSEEHTSELQSLMRISYAVFCLKKKKEHTTNKDNHTDTMRLTSNT